MPCDICSSCSAAKFSAGLIVTALEACGAGAGAAAAGAAAGWLNRDKVNKLAHSITDTLAGLDEVDFVEDRNTIRLEVRRILEELLNHEAKIDAAARHKIESQKRTILEGSQEWDILYRKYYNEEVKKLGI